MNWLLLFAVLCTPEFRNVAVDAGLRQSFPDGGTRAKKYIIETTRSGIAVIDYDNDGLPDTFLRPGEFEDLAISAGLGKNTRFVGWGCGFLDFDNDGWKDLLLVNGHVFPEVDKLPGDIHLQDRAILYRNQGNRTFADVSASVGSGIQEPHAARGLAVADFDSDGALKVVMNN